MKNNDKLSKLLSKVAKKIDEQPYESKMAFLGSIAGAAECVEEYIKKRNVNLELATEEEA